MHHKTRFYRSIFGVSWNPGNATLTIMLALLFPILLFLFLTLTAQPAPAQVFTTLYNFAWSDGAGPTGGLVQANDGNLYGTTFEGGTVCGYGCGTVFKITLGGTLTTLHSFVGSDGINPWAGLVQASDGNFYGTTAAGGNNNCGPWDGCGTVFKITPSGALTTLHVFEEYDGGNPYAGLVQASDGNFYGTTENGGDSTNCTYGCGTIFKITPGGSLTTLHSFARSDGLDPQTLMQASDGNLYGATFAGGSNDYGTVFKITLDGTLTTLHVFGGGDGANPAAVLVQASDGNLYGTTENGGANCSPHGCGTVFKITPGGTLTMLYSFAGSDGVQPVAGLVQAGDGNFYGTTQNGGADDLGTIFKITPGGTLTTLHSFAGSDGASPEAGLVQASDGNFYGPGYSGGANRAGTIFRMVMVRTCAVCPSLE